MCLSYTATLEPLHISTDDSADGVSECPLNALGEANIMEGGIGRGLSPTNASGVSKYCVVCATFLSVLRAHSVASSALAYTAVMYRQHEFER